MVSRRSTSIEPMFVRRTEPVFAMFKIPRKSTVKIIGVVNGQEVEVIKVLYKNEKMSIKDQRYFFSKYHLKADEVLEIRKFGRCDICGTKEFKGRSRKGYIDHDHKTGKVRGFLCSHCNSGLGFFKDDVQLMKNAIAYIEKNA